MNDMEQRLAEVGKMEYQGNSESAFSQRVRELQGVSETASLLAQELSDIERQLLGPRREPSSTDGSERPAYAGGSLNDNLEKYTKGTIESLSMISDSIRRIGEELGGVSENEPLDERPIGAEYMDSRR